jgi:hypothetical protein
MQVQLKSMGDLRDYFGREPVDIKLPEQATIQDLLLAIHQRWGRSLPAYLWDGQEKQFRGPVVLLIDDELILDKSTPLRDGMLIYLMKALAGG